MYLGDDWAVSWSAAVLGICKQLIKLDQTVLTCIHGVALHKNAVTHIIDHHFVAVAGPIRLKP